MTFRQHQIVQVVDAIDRDIHDVSRFIGRVGEVLRIGLHDGDSTFADVVVVGFCDGTEKWFWPEEVALP
jgi:hypothetical protein